jgi:CRP-like cAMP-binding protein
MVGTAGTKDGMVRPRRFPRNMKPKKKPQFSAKNLLAKAGAGRSVKRHASGEAIFAQSDAAEAIFYIRRGRVKLTVVSSRGKQAVIAILGTGDFFGVGCLAGQLVRVSSAFAMSECSLVRLEKVAVVASIHKEPAFSTLFL